MDDNPTEKRERAIAFKNKVKASLDSEFGSNIDWEGDSDPSLKFVVKTSKSYEMRLEYNATDDSFLLYDRDAKTQKNETLGSISPVNNAPSDVTDKVKSHAV